MKLPLDVRKLASSSKDLLAEKAQPVHVALVVDVEAPDVLIDAVREALRSITSSAQVRALTAAPGESVAIDPSSDVVIAVAGPGTTLGPALAAVRSLEIPAFVLALEPDPEAVARRLSHPLSEVVSELEVERVLKGFAKRVADRLHGKRVAFAANFPFARRAIAEEFVRATAVQNAAVGFVVIIPGADMPVMTANQAKMMLQIAAAYGEELGAERIKELAAIVGGGFALRAVARQAVNLVPGIGWVTKAGIGYSGTIAMGYAVIEYFESGGDVQGVAARLRGAGDKVAKAIAKRRRAKPQVAYTRGEHSTPAEKPQLSLPGGQAEMP